MNYCRNEYPRPQFRREEWQPLNGEWEFCFDDDCIGELKDIPSGKVVLDKKINVPFAYQTEASGINDVTHHEAVWYRRTFTVQNKEKNALLCFNASDYQTDVYINGKHATRHIGGFSPFSCDITKFLVEGENVIVVRCFDPLDNFNIRGKQSPTGRRYGCWYIPTTGIWQSVWIEYFNKDYIENYTLFTNLDEKCVYGAIKTQTGYANKAVLTVTRNNEVVNTIAIDINTKNGEFEIYFKHGILEWSMEHPNLYHVDMELYHENELLDRAHTRFGFKKISVENGRICLNGKPLYQKLILDQGYWKESSITPPSADALKQDILISKQMGFNGARKHQKFEDPYFYYYAEELGFLVWCEMPSAYRYCETEVQNISREWLDILSVAKNFTSVITYVLLNESWGVDNISCDKKIQNLATSLYYLTRSIDDTRLISVNDGWENMTVGDFYSVHDYAYDDKEFQVKYIDEHWEDLVPACRKLLVPGQKFEQKPILFDEFGGVAMKASAQGEAWGYGEGATDNEEIYKRIECLVKGIHKVPSFQGYCYTQLTDCEQEVNGLLDACHHAKFDVAKLKELFI